MVISIRGRIRAVVVVAVVIIVIIIVVEIRRASSGRVDNRSNHTGAVGTGRRDSAGLASGRRWTGAKRAHEARVLGEAFAIQVERAQHVHVALERRHDHLGAQLARQSRAGRRTHVSRQIGHSSPLDQAASMLGHVLFRDTEMVNNKLRSRP